MLYPVLFLCRARSSIAVSYTHLDVYKRQVEVQIPFLQYFLPYPFQIVPVTVWDQTLEVALEISQAVQELSRKRKIAVVASSDFSHYEPARVAEAKDSHAISCIVSLQSEEFYRVIRLSLIHI